jgi:hypothetical protein
VTRGQGEVDCQVATALVASSNWLPAPDGPMYVVMRLYWRKRRPRFCRPVKVPGNRRASSWHRNNGARKLIGQLLGPPGSCQSRAVDTFTDLQKQITRVANTSRYVRKLALFGKDFNFSLASVQFFDRNANVIA